MPAKIPWQSNQGAVVLSKIGLVGGPLFKDCTLIPGDKD